MSSPIYQDYIVSGAHAIIQPRQQLIVMQRFTVEAGGTLTIPATAKLVVLA